MCLDAECDAAPLDRRGFLAGSAVALAAGGAAAQDRAPPPTRVLDDPGILTTKVMFKHGGKETFDGFLARPKAAGQYPAVLVVAGNRITEEYIPNTCAALAVAGLVGLAPNVFHPLPAQARSREEVQQALKDHTEDDVIADVQAGADYLRATPFVRPGGFGVVGFCFGGRIALRWAARSLEADAVVPFHPGVASAEELARLRAPVQVHHGSADRSVDVAKSRELAQALRGKGKAVELFVYEGADHGFLAYTRPAYRPDDAKVAWGRAIDFLRKHLGQ